MKSHESADASVLCAAWRNGFGDSGGPPPVATYDANGRLHGLEDVIGKAEENGGLSHTRIAD